MSEEDEYDPLSDCVIAYERLQRQHEALAAEIAKLRDENAELIAAIDPFARIARINRDLGSLIGRGVPLREFIPGAWPVYSDCIRAEAALSKAKGRAG